MSVRPPSCSPRLSAAHRRPHSAGLRPSRPCAAALARCTQPSRPALFARRPRKPADPQPGFNPRAHRPLAQRLLKAARHSPLGRLLRHHARRIRQLQPRNEAMNLLIASLIRILALVIAVGLHGVLALTALG